MKKICSLLLCFIYCTVILSQEDESARSFKLNIVSKKGDNAAFAFFTVSGIMDIIPEKGGIMSFDNILQNDTLGLLVNGKKYLISIEGTDSLAIAINNNKATGYNAETKKKESLGKPVSMSNNATTIIDITSELKQYENLAEYLRGRVPGVIVAGNSRNGYQITIRGTSSLRSNSGPLFIVDGITIGSYELAESAFNFSDIAFVEVIKDGASYGLRGFGGVIKITTKKVD